MMTEVNMNVATYIKFDDITNALVDVKPTRLVSGFDGQAANSGNSNNNNNQLRANLLDTSFNVQLAFNNAIERLNNLAQPASAQQTPALGKLKSPNSHLFSSSLPLKVLSAPLASSFPPQFCSS